MDVELMTCIILRPDPKQLFEPDPRTNPTDRTRRGTGYPGI